MYAQERDAYSEAHRGAPMWLSAAIWLAWVIATVVATLLGEGLARAVESGLAPQAAGMPRALSIEGYVAAGGPLQVVAVVAGGIVAGAVLGIGQGLVLLPYLKVAGMLEWVGATIIGRGVGWIAIYAVARAMVGLVLDYQIVGVCVLFVLLVGLGVIAGAALGYAQGLVLRRRVEHSEWWALSNIPGPVVAALLIEATVYIQVENTIRDFSSLFIAIITGISTGIALTDLLRHPTTQAEWYGRQRLRRERVTLPQEDTVLGSKLYRKREE